jgi:hypothetical protein
MYEYDVYADARRTIPRLREPLQALDGEYFLVKVDPLAQTMSFSTSKGSIANLTTLSVSRVREIIALNRAGQKVETLIGEDDDNVVEEPTYRHEEDSITRFDNKGKRSKRTKRRSKDRGEQSAEVNTDAKVESKPEQRPEAKEEGSEPRAEREGGRGPRRDRGRRHDPRPKQQGDTEQNSAPAPEQREAKTNDSEQRQRGNRRHGRHNRDNRNRGERQGGNEQQKSE